VRPAERLLHDLVHHAESGRVLRGEAERLRGLAAALHHRPWPADPAPAVWLLEVDGPALVLGSTQAEPTGARSAEIEVVRRHSGGGAVLVAPETLVWVDVFVPADDRLWSADVGRAFGWLGDAWVRALAMLGVVPAVAHEGPLVHTTWSRSVCFAGLGPGEVTVAERKVVGISQRRRRAGALFQCAALRTWDAAGTVAALGLPPAAATELAGVAAGVPVDRRSLEEAFLGVVAAV
jgi:lipoate-protein ligase A